jgi:transcriptional antiterminator RfaH
LEAINTYKGPFIKQFEAIASWYAVYTRPHHEKEVYRRMKEQSIPVFLPLISTIRQWSDRKKKVSMPLFTCYIFVYIYNRDYYRILNIPGVVRFVTFDGKPVKIPEKQIRMVKNLIEQDMVVEEAKDTLFCGANVEIIAGTFIGYIGELVDFAGKKRVIIRFKEICKSLVVSVPMNLLKVIN